MLASILDCINKPQDLKRLSLADLEKLSREIRQLIIQTVAKNGGHLAPNLGVVELTIAIHRVFNSPYDKIVWDVGHQSYVHKILTGRRGQFATLRQLGGLCGYPKRSESEHDAFGTGHSSTSISSALGLALGRDISREKNSVIAVIGDGSLTGGEAYEAINHAGQLGTNLTVILNDNEMSISKNVGAMSEYLAKMRTAPSYSKMKHDIESLLRRIPAIGESVAKTAERVKDSLKYLVIPGVWFEELGFTYFGPIDGHNIPSLLDVLETAKNTKGPILVHVITRKGKGYTPAEVNPGQFHGVGPFNIETGEIIKKSQIPTYTQVFGNTMITLAEKNQDIVAVTAAMLKGTGLKQFAALYPQRFFDVGIAEPHAVTMAAGLAAQGKRPVVAMYSTFIQRAYDHVLHDVCIQKLPVVFALDRAGIVGQDGVTHQGVFDYSCLRHIPNIVIMAPKDENELRHMLYTATNIYSDPVVVRYPKGTGLGVPFEEPLHEILKGRAEELKTGKDIVLFAIGAMVEPCLKASEILAADGIAAGVVNARFVKPLDEQMIRKIVREVGVIVTVEDNITAGGFGSAVLEHINEQGFNWTKILRLGLPDAFIEHGSRNELLDKYGLTAEKIANSVSSFVKQTGVR